MASAELRPAGQHCSGQPHTFLSPVTASGQVTQDQSHAACSASPSQAARQQRALSSSLLRPPLPRPVMAGMASPGGAGVGSPGPATASSGTTVAAAGMSGGRFDFDDGGTFCGGWEDGKAHGHGVCTGPKGQGEYSGAWHYGFEVSGVYTWPSGSFFEGHWQNGKRHGLGVESRGKWMYRGEWTQGFKGRYGVRQSTSTPAKYEGTWANGLQDGYGSETYADGGTYQGQWLRGMRHGYGVRTSAAFGIASHSRGGDGARRPSVSSLQPGVEEPKPSSAMSNGSGPGGPGAKDSAELRGGFVLKSRSDEAPVRRRSLVERTGMKNLMQGLKIRKQRSTGDLDRKGVIGSIRSTGSTSSWMSSDSSHYAGVSVMSEGSQASFVVEDEMLDANVTETYMGEWKNDKRCGFGISERSDGLKYEGEWFNNRKYGYGVTTFKDGSREEGKYKNNILITSNKKKHLFLIRSAKFRERIDSAVNAAQRASKIALQKADIAISRTATARGKAEQADYAAVCAREDSSEARGCAQNFDPNFHQPDGETPGKGLFLQHEVDHKPDLRLGGVGGPGPPPLTNHVAPPLPAPPPPSQSVINVHPPPGPAPAPVRPPPPASVPPAPSLAPKPQSQPAAKAISPSEPTHNNVSDIPVLPTIKPKPAPAPAPAPVRPSQSAPVPIISAPAPRPDVLTPSVPDPGVTRQPAALQPVAPEPGPARGRTPTRQERSRAAQHNDTGAAQGPAGGYNFQKIMDDRFEHYKRPPSRERSAGLGSRQGSRQQLGGVSRDASRDRLHQPQAAARPASRQRTPMAGDLAHSDNKNNGLDSLDLDGASAVKQTGNGSIAGNNFSTDFKLPAEDQIRFRGVQQEIPHFGAVPKRTESLYMKPGQNNQQATFQVLGSSAMQRKKSLPDVACLPAVTVKQGSAAMTREEISVLSSARRDEIRRQLEEAERYRANPVLYILNPHIRDWFSRQQLMMMVLFLNVTLAIMFFKLLT